MPDMALIDERVLPEYVSGDDAARGLVSQLLNGEVSLALSAHAALHSWCHQVPDRREEIKLYAVLRFIEQVPLTDEIARTAGTLFTQHRAALPEDAAQAALKAVTTATSLEMGLPVYSKDVDWYESRGCVVVGY